jgi:hypothetical protein
MVKLAIALLALLLTATVAQANDAPAEGEACLQQPLEGCCTAAVTYDTRCHRQRTR